MSFFVYIPSFLSVRKLETWLPWTKRSLRFLITSMPQYPMASAVATTTQAEKRKCGNWKAEHPKSTIREDQVCDHLRNLNVYKPMGHNEIHLRVLRELSNKVAKP